MPLTKLPPITERDIVRFEKKVARSLPDECWIWKGAGKNGDYGHFRLGGKMVYAHRVALAIAMGEDPFPLFACHHCDVRRCCNPSHLYAGTHKQNVADRVTRDRSARGLSHGMTKLSDEQVVEMRKLNRQGVSAKLLSGKFNVSYYTAWDITSGRRRKRAA